MKILFLIIPFILAIGPFESPNDLVKKGNKFYSEKKYDEALSYYDKAEEKASNKAPIIYNRGNALLRQNDIQGAIKEYQKSASMADGGADGKLKAMSLYNMGNALFTEGKYEEAARAYKEAIKHDPSDINAKVNLEITLNKMKEEEQKEDQEKEDKESKEEDSKDKQEEGDESQDDENKKQDSKDDSGKEQKDNKEEQDSGEKADDGKSNENMKNEEPNDENEEGSTGQGNAGQEDSTEDNGSEAAGGLTKGEMTREEAERIINNMGDSNMNLQIMTDMVKGAPSGVVEKDW